VGHRWMSSADDRTIREPTCVVSPLTLTEPGVAERNLLEIGAGTTEVGKMVSAGGLLK